MLRAQAGFNRTTPYASRTLANLAWTSPRAAFAAAPSFPPGSDDSLASISLVMLCSTLDCTRSQSDSFSTMMRESAASFMVVGQDQRREHRAAM